MSGIIGRTLGSGASVMALLFCAVAPTVAQAGSTDSVAAAADLNTTAYAPAFFAEFRPVTALDMISRIPGFQFDGGSSARGFAGTAGNVLIDGERPPTRSDSLSNVLSRIPATRVLRIDIVRAGAGGIDMQGKSVVANVIRRPDAGLTGSMSSSLTVTDTLRLQPSVSVQVQRQAGGRALDGALRLSGGGQDGRTVRDRRSPAGVALLQAQSDSRFDYTSGETTGVYEGPLGGGRVRGNVLLNYSDNLHESVDSLLMTGGAERSADETTRWRGEAGLRWTRGLPRGVNLELVGFQSATDTDSGGRYQTPNYAADTLTHQMARESIVSAALKFPALGDWSVETGSELALNRIETGTGYILNGQSLRLAGDDTRVEELRNESFVTGTRPLGSGLNLTAGLRYEISRITADGNAGGARTNLAYLKPRLGLTWTPRPRETVNLKLEQNVDQLSFNAFTASAAFETGIFGRGNPDIRPARTWLASARYERLFDRQGSIVAELLHERQEDVLGTVVIHEIPPGGTAPRAFNITRNVGTARRDRLSLSARHPLDDLGLGGGLLSGQLVLRRSETEDPVTGALRRLSGDQPVSWNLGLSQNLTARRINWNLNLSSGQDQRSYAPSTVSQARSAPAFNASISYRPDATLSLSAGLYVGGDSTGSYTLFSAPRDRGTPVYTEQSQTDGNRQAYVSARRSF